MVQWSKRDRPCAHGIATRGNANDQTRGIRNIGAGGSGTPADDEKPIHAAGNQERGVGVTGTRAHGDSGTTNRGNANADSE